MDYLQIVVVIGAGPSAVDTSREIAEVAKEVHVSTRSASVLSKLVIFAELKKHSEVSMHVDAAAEAIFSAYGIPPESPNRFLCQVLSSVRVLLT